MIALPDRRATGRKEGRGGRKKKWYGENEEAQIEEKNEQTAELMLLYVRAIDTRRRDGKADGMWRGGKGGEQAYDILAKGARWWWWRDYTS